MSLAASRVRAIVLDASIVVPWFVAEPVTPVAERLLETPRPLIAPRHLLPEVTNALLTQQRRGRLPRGQAEAACNLLSAMGVGAMLPRITFFDEDEALFFRRAVGLSEDLGHSLYDCFYLVLAQREGASLATFDRRMIELARRLSIPVWAAEDSA